MDAVLIVDDDKTQQLIVSKILKSIGLRVIIASDGVEALEQIRDCSPRLVILDLLMPRMNGNEVCRHIKADEQTHQTPVVMYSGQEREFDGDWEKANYADAYLSKLCRPQALIDTVTRLLGCHNYCCAI